MSDLALFVAAVLRDRTVQDLLDEINRLRVESLTLRITGRDGTPVFYEVLVTNGRTRYLDDERLREITFPARNDASGNTVTSGNYFGVPFHTFQNDLEFRLGGIVLRKNSEYPIRLEPDFFLGPKDPRCFRGSYLFLADQRGPLCSIVGSLQAPRDGMKETDLSAMEHSEIPEFMETTRISIEKVLLKESYFANLIRD